MLIDIGKCQTYVVATFRFAGIHRWASQPDSAPRRYLAAAHRHLFHAEVAVEVSHDDRDVEILALREAALDAIRRTFPTLPTGEFNLGESSCESLCKVIASSVTAFVKRPALVKVFEDGENGANLVLL